MSPDGTGGGLAAGGGTSLSDVRAYKWLAALVIAVFVLLAARLWQLQVIEGDRLYRRTADNIIKEIPLPAARGQIRDRKGRVLVDNRPSYNVYLRPTLANDATVARLVKHLALSEEQRASLQSRISTALTRKGADRAQELLAFEDVTRDQMGAIESDAAELPGVTVEAVAHRTYPFGTLAAHTLGYMNQIGADELAALRDQGYRPGDYVGRSGVERQWESYLRGKDGFAVEVQDARGHLKTDLDEQEIDDLVRGPRRRDPAPGDNLVLTIDLDLQRIVEKALAHHRSAAAIVVDVETGQVLALASHPSFDPNVLTGRLTRVEDERLQKDPYRPLTDKALHESFFPASTFKIIPALAGLGDKLIEEYDRIICRGAYEKPGHSFRCMKSHGPMTLYSAIVESCNVYFYQLGEKVTMDRMAKLAEEFGFGAPTGIGLQEAAGFVPTTDWYKKQGGFRIGYTLNTAIGQGSTKVTLIQMALAYAALANGGDLYVPQLALRVETPSGKTVQDLAPRLRRHLALEPAHVELVRRALCGVVNDEKGTAHAAFDPTVPVEVCGKSGTAQVRKNRKGEVAGWDVGNDHAWFTGFAPAKHPRIALALIVEHGGLGGHVAGPTAMEIVKGYFTQIEPVNSSAKTPAVLDGGTVGICRQFPCPPGTTLAKPAQDAHP